MLIGNAPAGRTAACARDKVVERDAVVLERVIDFCRATSRSPSSSRNRPRQKPPSGRVERGGVAGSQNTSRGHRRSASSCLPHLTPSLSRTRQRASASTPMPRSRRAPDVTPPRCSLRVPRAHPVYEHPATRDASGRTKVHSNEVPPMLAEVQLARVPVRDDDVRQKLQRLLREGGFVDVAPRSSRRATTSRRRCSRSRSSTVSRCCGHSTIRQPMRSQNSGPRFSSSTSGGWEKGWLSRPTDSECRGRAESPLRRPPKKLCGS